MILSYITVCYWWLALRLNLRRLLDRLPFDFGACSESSLCLLQHTVTSLTFTLFNPTVLTFSRVSSPLSHTTTRIKFSRSSLLGHTCTLRRSRICSQDHVGSQARARTRRLAFISRARTMRYQLLEACAFALSAPDSLRLTCSMILRIAKYEITNDRYHKCNSSSSFSTSYTTFHRTSKPLSKK